jgi:hypothetical protein
MGRVRTPTARPEAFPRERRQAGRLDRASAESSLALAVSHGGRLRTPRPVMRSRGASSSRTPGPRFRGSVLIRTPSPRGPLAPDRRVSRAGGVPVPSHPARLRGHLGRREAPRADGARAGRRCCWLGRLRRQLRAGFGNSGASRPARPCPQPHGTHPGSEPPTIVRPGTTYAGGLLHAAGIHLDEIRARIARYAVESAGPGPPWTPLIGRMNG